MLYIGKVFVAHPKHHNTCYCYGSEERTNHNQIVPAASHSTQLVELSWSARQVSERPGAGSISGIATPGSISGIATRMPHQGYCTYSEIILNNLCCHSRVELQKDCDAHIAYRVLEVSGDLWKDAVFVSVCSCMSDCTRMV